MALMLLSTEGMTYRRLLVPGLLAMLWGGCEHSAASPTPLPQSLDAQGRYALESPIDVPPTVLVSSSANRFLSLLRQLRDDPATGLITTLDEAGVPLAADLYGVLPGSLKDLVRSSINDYMRARTQTDGGAGADIDQLLAFADSTLARFTLRSTLTVPTEIAQGSAKGTHTVDTLVFQIPGGVDVPVPPEVLQKAMVFPGALETTTMLAVAGSSQGGDGALSLGDHFFGLAYGEAVFSALDGAGQGETLRTRLGRIFDCPAMGDYVAKRCLSILCIGHAAEITAICSQGLDKVVEKLHESLAGLSFQALRFKQGDGWLWDAATDGGTVDGLVHRIDHGTWDASLDVSTGARACKASFAGQRL
jgi:hypothetical protein